MPPELTGTELDHLLTLPAVLGARANLQPGDEALVILERRLNWRELEQATGRVAAGLHQIGVRPGDHVGICMGNSVEWVLTWYAAAHLGAAVVPLNTRWKDEEFAWAVDYADVSVLVYCERLQSAQLAAMVERVRPSLPKVRYFFMVDGDANTRPAWAEDFNSLETKSAALPPSMAQPTSITLMQFTSGSTARPKGVLLTQAGMLTNARGSSEALGMHARDRYFSPRPFFHVAGSTGGILRSLVTGACLISIPAFDEIAAIDVLRRERCQLVAGNDAMFLKLLASVDAGGGVHGLMLRGGQAAAGPEVQRQIYDRLGISGLCCSYGLSEASPGVSFSRWDDPLEDRIAGRMWPLPGVQVQIRDPQSGELMPPGASAEIFIKGPSVMVGYYQLPEATRAVLDERGWLATGDLGVLEASGQLRFIGRLKDVIRVGGENLAPAELEDLLLRHPAVSAVQVVSVPYERLGEVPAAFIVLRRNATMDETELIAWARARIAGFKVPRYVWLVDSFDDVMTGSGKPQKNLLRERALKLKEQSA